MLDARQEAHQRVAPRQRRAVQVVPIKPILIAPETKLSKVRYDEPLSNFAFNINLRRYSTGEEGASWTSRMLSWQGLENVHATSSNAY